MNHCASATTYYMNHCASAIPTIWTTVHPLSPTINHCASADPYYMNHCTLYHWSTKSKVACIRLSVTVRRKLNYYKIFSWINSIYKHYNLIQSDQLYVKNTYIYIKENRIYIRGEFTRKKCKMAILLYCFNTAGVLHIFMLYNLLGPGISFYRKSKISIKKNQIMK